MDIVVGKNAGFCYGVKRAVEGAEQILENSTQPIYCLGEIVHNQDVVKNLENKGMKFIENINDANNILLIRAHGVKKEIYEEGKKFNLDIRDYTCPKVLKIHEIAQEYAEKGYYIILTGSKKHPENVGTISFCGKDHIIIEDLKDLEMVCEDIKNRKFEKILLISQTTFSVEKFHLIREMLEKNLDKEINFVVKNTICQTTKIRQDETEKMAKQVDAMIIIGGKNSSNTKKLFEIAQKYCKFCFAIENEKDLDLDLLKNIDKIGVMAGASTPQFVIDKVVSKLKLI